MYTIKATIKICLYACGVLFVALSNVKSALDGGGPRQISVADELESLVVPHQAIREYSVVHETVHEEQTEEQQQQTDAINSLDYWVDGEWVAVDPETSNNLAVPSDGFFKDSNGDDAQLDPLYFKPTHVQPIQRMTLAEALQEAREANADMMAGIHNKDLEQELKPEESLPLLEAVQYRRFRSEQAQQCLRNKRVFMIGDSHMRNLWRGLNDVVAGHLETDYRRFDGHKAPKSPDEELPRVVPSNYQAGFFPFPPERTGLAGACSIKPVHKRKPHKNGYGAFGMCSKAPRRQFDMRTLECDACEANDISIDFSGCATSFRNLLDFDLTGTTDGPSCRHGYSAKTRKAPETLSQWAQILRNGTSTNDIVVMGFHAHDIKGTTCEGFGVRNMTEQDYFTCRYQRGLELLQNAEQVAREAQEKGIRLFWTTYTFEDVKNIPEQYRPFQRTGDMFRERRALAGIMRNYGHAVFDTFHMALSARRKQDQIAANGGQWPNFFESGSHDSRLLARMRIHVLLNSLCPDMGEEDVVVVSEQ